MLQEYFKDYFQIARSLFAISLLVLTCTVEAQNQPATDGITKPAAQQTAPQSTSQDQSANQAQSVNQVQTVNAPGTTAPVPAAATNAPAAPVSLATKPNTASQLANLLGSLALILVLIFGLSWFVKRFSQGGFLQNPAMKVVASMPLGTRERLMLVDIGGKQILLGVTATQISTLHVFDHPVVMGSDKEPGSDFSQKLMAILQQKNSSPSGDSSPRDRQA